MFNYSSCYLDQLHFVVGNLLPGLLGITRSFNGLSNKLQVRQSLIVSQLFMLLDSTKLNNKSTMTMLSLFQVAWLKFNL
jgi:hypothetical protein